MGLLKHCNWSLYYHTARIQTIGCYKKSSTGVNPLQCRIVGFVLYTRITLINIKLLLSVGGLGHLSIVIAKDKAIQNVIGLFVENEACDEKTFIVNKTLSALM